MSDDTKGPLTRFDVNDLKHLHSSLSSGSAMVQRLIEVLSAQLELAEELKRYREREPLVQQMVTAIMDDPQQLDADEPACAIVRFGDPATPAPSAEAEGESS
jgi:propanediol dehydratase large subunit